MVVGTRVWMHKVVVFREVTSLQADDDERVDVSQTGEYAFWVNEMLHYRWLKSKEIRHFPVRLSYYACSCSWRFLALRFGSM